MRTNGWKVLLAWMALALLMAACQPVPGAGTNPTAQPGKIRFATFNILEALPLYVAQQQGYFKAQNVEVEIVPVASAPERDQLLAAGQVDGAINEVLSTLFFNKDSAQLQVVRYARTATSGAPLFRILAAANSGITSVEDLKGVEIGVSNGTIIEYLTDRLLLAEGLTAADIQLISVPAIPDRLALLGSGQLKAAVLPDPLASLAMTQGAVNVLDDSSHPEYSFSTVSFRTATIEQNPAGVRAFLAAYEQAVRDINATPDNWKTLLVEQKILPQPLAESFQVPQFATAAVPTEQQVSDTLQWAIGKGLLTKEIAYEDVVNATFLPQ